MPVSKTSIVNKSLTLAGASPIVNIDEDSNNARVALQFTGLLDKNGKEIYEGDIVRCDKQEWYRTDRSMGRDVVGKPEYQEEVIWEFEMLTMRQNDYPQYWTVIGNIYENPELLLNKAKPEEGK